METTDSRARTDRTSRSLRWRRATGLLAAGIIWLAPCLTVGQTADPVELIRRVQRQDTAPGEEVQFVMQLVNSSGQIRERTGTVYERQTAANSVDEMRLIRYYSPADIKGSGVLTIEHSDRANDQWLYLPAYHTTRRIAPANRGNRYMGSDFLYEDIMRERVEEYQYGMSSKDTLGSVPCVVLEAVPVAPQLVRETAYSKKLIWVDPERDLILRVDFFNREAQLFKRLTVTEVEKVGQKYRWRDVRMENLVPPHTTIMKYHGRKFEAVPESYFTEQYLKRGQ